MVTYIFALFNIIILFSHIIIRVSVSTVSGVCVCVSMTYQSFIAFLYGAGVKSVEINRKQQKVTVVGYVEANKVLKKAKSTGKKAEIWPYVPYNMVAHPYAVSSYDKKAPPGYVRRLEATTGMVTTYEDSHLTNMFSDENPNACFIM